MKPTDVTSDSYTQYSDSNEKDPKFKISTCVTFLRSEWSYQKDQGDLARISKHKNIFAKGYTKNWSEKVFTITKIKDTVSWTYVISDLNGEPITEKFYEKKCKKLIKKKWE